MAIMNQRAVPLEWNTGICHEIVIACPLGPTWFTITYAVDVVIVTDVLLKDC